MADTLLALDAFTGTNGDDINVHVPDSGISGWHKGETDPGWAEIQSNKLQMCRAGIFGGNGYLLAAPALQNDNVLIQAKVRPGSGLNFGNKVGLCLRCNSSNGTSGGRQFINCLIQNTLSAGVYNFVVERIAGADPPAEEFFVAGNVAIANMHTTGIWLRATAVGNVVSIYTRPADGSGVWTLRGAATLVDGYLDSNHRQIGLRGTNFSSTNADIEDLEFYSMNVAPTAPTVTAPIAGEYRAADGMTVAWNAATDPNLDALQYEGQYSVNGGDDWISLFALQSGLTYDWDTVALEVTDQAMVRVRAFDGELYGPYDESAEFSIVRTWTQVPRPAGSWVDEPRPAGSWVQA